MTHRPFSTTGGRSRLRLAPVIVGILSTGIATLMADSPTVSLITPNTSLLKAGNWSTDPVNDPSGNPPTAGQTGTIAEGASANPIGWNNNTNPGSTTIGDLDFISGSTSLVIGNYTTKTANTAVSITLGGSTLNSIANTVLANSSGNTIVFQNDVAPSGDDKTESGTTTYVLGNATNVIQATATSNIIIDNVITGTGNALSFLGGGTSSMTGATLELGAGSANDVVGGIGANVPVAANAGSFTGTATVQSSDQNSFTGGLTIGDVGGVANAGIVKVDGANALPTTGTITINANSQLLLNGSATYGGATQSLVLNGNGTNSTAGALSTASGNSSTWQGTVSVASASSVNVQGTGKLVLSGNVSGSAQLQKTGAGELDLNGSNGSFSGGLNIAQGAVVAGNVNGLGTGAVTVAGGSLSSSVTTANVGGQLSLTSGAIQLLAQAQATFSLASGQNLSMSGGALDLTYNGSNTGSISSAGGGSSFSITNGTIDLGGSAWNYAGTYDILNGFGSGSVSGLAFTDYDSTDFTAHLSNGGVLSFAPTPEPTSSALICFSGLLTLGWRRSRRSAR